jgi:hypothetical protein
MTRTVIVRYQTSPEAAAENVRLVQDVYAALAKLAPVGFRYSTYQLADGVTFVHVALLDAAENPLQSLPEFAEFQRGLPERCVVLPDANEAATVGAYG